MHVKLKKNNMLMNIHKLEQEYLEQTHPTIPAYVLTSTIALVIRKKENKSIFTVP